MNSSQRVSNSSNNIPPAIKLTDLLRPVFQEAFIVKEYCTFTRVQSGDNDPDSQDQIKSSRLPGVYVIPSAHSIYMWFGALFVNSSSSPWHGGVFRFVIRFPENYPTGIPAVTFLPITLVPQQGYKLISSHPDINEQGGFNLKPYVSSPPYRTYKIMKQIRKAFYRQFNEPELGNTANQSAGLLAKQNYNEFIVRARADAEESQTSIEIIDKYVLKKFNNDHNLMILGGINHLDPQDNQTGANNNKHVGLSFML
ncbi:unnamed protein product [Orchesella dallaii]|uniref:UBC core domain-containing protein n=1 Tax=Orchesella dallaii TaxID=48710 RepID=A0ABP1PKF6_9HEXA